MRKKEDYKRLIILLVFGMLSAGALATGSFLTRQQTTNTQAAGDISLESYCQDGWYQIPGEKRCSRAPNCGGRSYDDVKNIPPANAQWCMSEHVEGSGIGGCEGSVPVCCYEVARTGDFTKCVGYWERLWCAPNQCNQARANGASDNQCGGSCQCGHAFTNYCGGDKPIIPLAQRLGMQQPTNTPRPPTPTNTRIPTAPPQATNTPIPTNTPRPTIPVPTSTPQPTAPPGQPTYTPVPTSTPVPTATQTPQQPNTTPFVPPQAVTLPPESSNQQPHMANNPPNNAQQESTPPSQPIEIASPKELAREVINPQNVQKLNDSTEIPLEAPRKAFSTIKEYDNKLEQTVERWIFPWRVRILQFMQKYILSQ